MSKGLDDFPPYDPEHDVRQRTRHQAEGFEACRHLVLALLARKPILRAWDVYDLGNPYDAMRNAHALREATAAAQDDTKPAAEPEPGNTGPEHHKLCPKARRLLGECRCHELEPT